MYNYIDKRKAVKKHINKNGCRFVTSCNEFNIPTYAINKGELTYPVVDIIEDSIDYMYHHMSVSVFDSFVDNNKEMLKEHNLCREKVSYDVEVRLTDKLCS